MLRQHFPLYIFLSILLTCQESKEVKINTLRKTIEKQFAEQKASFALVYFNLDNNERMMINENQRFHAASTMKVPVMIEAFKQAKKGLFQLSDSIQVVNQFRSIVDGSVYQMSVANDGDDGLYSFIGRKRTIHQLIYDMIIYSSNLATNILVNLLDAKKITASMRELGADSIEVLRGVEDLKAYRQGLSNTTTALDLAVIMEQLRQNQIVDHQASKKMIQILMDQKYNDVIPKHLPNDVKIAHKTGWITGLQHDSGIVYLLDGRSYVLVLLSSNMKKFNKGKAMLADVSKLIYEHVIAE